jgi:hypothetical protein
MNFRDLVTRLDLIEDAGLTLATVQAAENLARDKATAEKTKGGWTGFTSWDPKTAGNIAVAKLAQANRLDGLFNSDGDFIVAYGNNEWSSKEGQAPRTAPPTPEDWKPLASRGLIPSNAKGPAGLTNWLTGGKSNSEFKAAQAQSAGMQKTDMQKADEVDALINQLQSQTAAPATVASADAETDGSEENQEFAEGMYESLVESFGYQAEANFPTTYEEFKAYPIVTLPNGDVIYAGADLIVDVGISIVFATVGPAAGPLLIPRLAKLANIIRKVFGATKPVSKEAISAVVSTYKERLALSLRAALGAGALATTALGTMGINVLMLWVEKTLNSKFDPADLGKKNNSTMPDVDAMGNVTGASN